MSLCLKSLVLVHVSVRLVPGVLGVHGHSLAGGQSHHGFDVLILAEAWHHWFDVLMEGVVVGWVWWPLGYRRGA